MINVETEIFSAVEQAVRAEYPDIFLTGEYVPSPSSFPAVSIVEISNTVYRDSSTNTETENHAAVTYEVNIFSNKTRGRKSECREIADIVDQEFTRLGFTRTMLQPVSNMADISIYRMLGRYRAIVGKNHTIYRYRM